MSRHLVRINAPRTWQIPRKSITFITKPHGSHPTELSLPLLIILRDILHYAGNAREAKKLALNEEILVDGKRVKDIKRSIGLFDILSIPKIKEHYRIFINRHGKVSLQKSIEEKLKPCKIIGKTLVNGKIQLNLHDGNNIFADNSYKVGDTVVLELPSKKILHHFKLEKGSTVYITGGKHIGDTGKIESISDSIVCKNNESQVFIMPKYYAFVLGKEKSVITI